MNPPSAAMDQFLFKARANRDKVAVSLRGGTTVVGRIKAFDAYSILLELYGEESLIYKSGISAIQKMKRQQLRRGASDRS